MLGEFRQSLVRKSDGSLAAVPGSPFPGVFFPDEVIVHPNGRFVFVTNRSQPSLSVFALGADGSLAPVPGSPFPAPAGFTTYEHCILNSRGTLLFATFEAPPAILAYRVGEDGSLSPVPGTPVLLGTPGPGGPEGMALDPAGRIIYVADHIAVTHDALREARGSLRVVVVAHSRPEPRHRRAGHQPTRSRARQVLWGQRTPGPR